MHEKYQVLQTKGGKMRHTKNKLTRFSNNFCLNRSQIKNQSLTLVFRFDTVNFSMAYSRKNININIISWCTKHLQQDILYHNILSCQMYRIQKLITLHSSLSILHPPLFTLNPTIPLFTLHLSTFSRTTLVNR